MEKDIRSSRLPAVSETSSSQRQVTFIALPGCGIIFCVYLVVITSWHFFNLVLMWLLLDINSLIPMIIVALIITRVTDVEVYISVVTKSSLRLECHRVYSSCDSRLEDFPDVILCLALNRLSKHHGCFQIILVEIFWRRVIS